MKKSTKMRRNSPLRSSIRLIFLPVIIFIWMIGWIITQIVEPTGSTKISQKNLRINLKSKDSEIEPELQDEDSRIINEPIIA
jgi:hypothetical protein